jgi:hypothetical protein
MNTPPIFKKAPKVHWRDPKTDLPRCAARSSNQIVLTEEHAKISCKQCIAIFRRKLEAIRAPSAGHA